eukprot:403361200
MKNYLSLASALLLGAVKGNNQILKVDSSGTIDKKLKESHHNSQVPKYYNDASNGVTDIQRFNSNVQPDSGHKPVYHKPAERDHSRDGQRKKSRDAAHFRKAVPSHDHDIVRTASFSPVNHKLLDNKHTKKRYSTHSRDQAKVHNQDLVDMNHHDYYQLKIQHNHKQQKKSGQNPIVSDKRVGDYQPHLGECRICHYEGRQNRCWWTGSDWEWGNENEVDYTSDHSFLTSVLTDHQVWTSPDDDGDSGSDITNIHLEECDWQHHVVFVVQATQKVFKTSDGVVKSYNKAQDFTVKTYEPKSFFTFQEDDGAHPISKEQPKSKKSKNIKTNKRYESKDRFRSEKVEKQMDQAINKNKTKFNGKFNRDLIKADKTKKKPHHHHHHKHRHSNDSDYSNHSD